MSQLLTLVLSHLLTPATISLILAQSPSLIRLHSVLLTRSLSLTHSPIMSLTHSKKESTFCLSHSLLPLTLPLYLFLPLSLSVYQSKTGSVELILFDIFDTYTYLLKLFASHLLYQYSNRELLVTRCHFLDSLIICPTTKKFENMTMLFPLLCLGEVLRHFPQVLENEHSSKIHCFSIKQAKI